MTDSMILWNSKEASTSVYKSAKNLLKVLKDAGVVLNHKGEIDTSAIGNPEVEKAIKSNPLTKVVLSTNAEINKFPEKEHVERQPTEYTKPYDGPGMLIDWNAADPYKRYFETLKPEQVESVEQRQQRLEEMWSSRKLNDEEQAHYQYIAIDKLQEVRRKIDQILVKNGHTPIYTQQSKGDLMLDAKYNIQKMEEYLIAEEEDLVETAEDALDYERVQFYEETKGLDEGTINPYYDRDFSYKHQLEPELSYTDEEHDYSDDDKKSDEDDDIKLDYQEGEFDTMKVDEQDNEEEGQKSKKKKETKKTRLEKALKKLSDKSK